VAGLLDQIAGLADTPQKRAALAALVGELEKNPAHPPERFNRGVRNVAGGMAKAIGEGIAFPRKYMETYQPGSMAADNPAATEWAAGTAMNMVGAPALTGGVPGMGAGIRAYHGSPHDFDRFDMSKIGTGEGAQAYGHGLYFAERPEVARQYRDNLSGFGFDFSGSGKPVNADLSRILSDLQREKPGLIPGDYIDLAVEKLRAQQKDAAKAGDFDWYNKAANLESEAFHLRKDAPQTKGRMYEVNINAAPEQFLDWDRPLSGQPANVMGAAQKLDPTFVKKYPGEDDLPSGQALYNYLRANRGTVTTSEALREAGIPGIKYLDQGSRGAGSGTNNYVVFDDKIIEILRKYGLAGLAAMPALANAPQLEQAQ
jgi:hypothetical protein